MSVRVYHFIVTGNGPFPLDMLRYDAAWPRTTDDALVIARTFKDRGPEVATVVSLTSHTPATVGRWHSFGWKVIASEVQTIY